MSIIIQSPQEDSKIKALLEKDIPSYRQAYSDRTSMIMACLSELVYLKFNEPLLDETQKRLAKNVTKLLGKEKASSIYKLLDLLAYDNQAEEDKLKKELLSLDLTLKETFDEKGTQAIIVESEKFYVLAFRGTEANSMADIKTDFKANKVPCESGGNMHQGFKDAFSLVHNEIQTYINKQLKDKPLFITGHSLGGALATVATKKLVYEQIAACYTYGSPRVGDEEWMLGIKSPVYRLVNSADPVTMLPPGSETVDIFSLFVKLIPAVGVSWSQYLERNFGGYSHVGYMRYLSDIEKGKFQNAKLLYSVSFFRRIRAYIFKKGSYGNKSFLDIPSDHKMTTYRKKLQQIAYDRQDIK